MAEEHACLVRARSDSDSEFGAISRAMTYTDDKLNTTEASGEPAAVNAINLVVSPPEHVENESGELLDYNDASVLDQFHEDAIRQAGCGMCQIRVIFACTLAIAGASLELSAIPFVLPSAEIELCVMPHERNWLVLISLMGCAFGAVGWAALSARLGRRRSLLSCLAVNAVFATIAAFMPTYGTFMMARFCSALGSGGILPLCYSYFVDISGRVWARGGALGAALAGGTGPLLAALLAATVLPADGAATLAENREHFSAWHRYLLICTLPIVISLISLIWTQESPRYLLDVGREVDAMSVYQTIHSCNKLPLCSVGRVAGNPREAEYRLGELSLPGKRRPAIHLVRHGVKMFWQTFFQLFSSIYISTTLTFILTIGFSFTIQFFLSGYVPFTVVSLQHAAYESSTTSVRNVSVDQQYYNTTIQNTVYDNTTFSNSSFRDLLMFHVTFRNCSFRDVTMVNIKSSRTLFYGCTFINSTIIDTDMESGVEFDEWCVFNGTFIRGMKGGCARHADLTSKLSGMITEQTYIAHATFIAAIFIPLPERLRPVAVPSGLLLLLSPLLYWVRSETALYAMAAAYRLLATALIVSEALRIYQVYPGNLRCTAHGFILSISYVLAAGAWDAGVSSAGVSGVACVCVGVSAVLVCGGAGRRRGER